MIGKMKTGLAVLGLFTILAMPVSALEMGKPQLAGALSLSKGTVHAFDGAQKFEHVIRVGPDTEPSTALYFIYQDAPSENSWSQCSGYFAGTNAPTLYPWKERKTPRGSGYGSCYVYSIPSDISQKLYLLTMNRHGALGEGIAFTLLGVNPNGTSVQYFNTENLLSSSKVFFYASDKKIKSSAKGDTLVIPYSRPFSLLGLSLESHHYSVHGELRYKWNEKAQWFDVKRVETPLHTALASFVKYQSAILKARVLSFPYRIKSFFLGKH